jgi:uncharacterized cofD-like protein
MADVCRKWSVRRILTDHEEIMQRWFARWPRLKWLQPGIGVKRWVLLALAGLTLIGAGAAGLAGLIDAPLLRRLVAGTRPAFLSPLAQIALFLLAGGVLLAMGAGGLNRSLLAAFRRNTQGEVVDVVYRHRQRRRGPKIVAIGGGHGLNTLLRGLKEYTDHLTAIVTVADDGGSSGRLRRDLGILPPGDFRNCIAALSDDEGLMSQLFQYRFGDDSDLDGHSFGNLYLTAMTAITGSFQSALDESRRVLAVRGRVLPSTVAQVVLSADLTVPAASDSQATAEGRWQRIHGESQITATLGRVQRVYLSPEDAPAYPEAIRAILEADMIAIGPGSLYTSVLPNLLVRDLARAIAAAPAPKVYVCNVATQAGETTGYDVSEHVRALRDHVGPGLFQIVLANHTFTSSPPPGADVDWVHLPRSERLDYRLITRDLVDPRYPWRHDPAKLAQALVEFVKP